SNVLHYDDSGNLVEVLWAGSPAPIGIAFGPDGALYTSNLYLDQIRRYNALTLDFDPFTPSGGVANPHEITFGGPLNDLYVADAGGFTPGDHKFRRFDGETGAYIESIDAPGPEDWVGIAVDNA